jgi:hypothetical protein
VATQTTTSPTSNTSSFPGTTSPALVTTKAKICAQMEYLINPAGPDISMHPHQTLVLSADTQMTDSCPLLSV